jgi:type II secretory pathway pseudopilin PulG
MKNSSHYPLYPTAFSMVEVLAAIAIIGIVTFLAIPNLVRIKEDGERSLAISRAEAVNMAMAAFVQANGATAADTAWVAAGSNGRYGLLAPYLAFAPADVDDYMPGGYTLQFPADISPITKVGLKYGTSDVAGYGQ